MTISQQVPVLIAGGGPSGLILALQLAKHGVKSMLVERNESTTKWPKMDITNCRTMELFNRLGISKGLRDIGVPKEYPFNVLFSSGLSDGGEKLAQWDLPSVEKWYQRIREQNDGTMPREPYQRCSQAIFEAWLKPRIQQDPLIESHFGVRLEALKEVGDGVESYLVDVKTGEKHTVQSQYVAGCDGAGSRVRKAIGGELVGGQVVGATLLVHFRSRDLTKLHRQGHFWHIFFTQGAVIISQDEVETWTIHLPIPLDTDWRSMDSKQAIYDALGGSVGPCPIKVDEILVTSMWRPTICIAEHYMSEGKRVFLSGDAAHQNVPHGGYGMNTAIGDSFDLGWKLAAMVKGHGGKYLLDSYQIERKPVAARNIERSGVHVSVHQDYVRWVKEAGPGVLTTASDAGQKLRQKIESYATKHDGENKEHGNEMGYRYNGSPIIIHSEQSAEPEWSVRDYIASTWPGARAPHVFLTDGNTSIFDLFGRDYTVVDFTQSGAISKSFAQTAAELNIPVKRVHLPSETHVRNVWERDVVLIRPDDHVAWRLPRDGTALDTAQVINILETVTGKRKTGVHGKADIDALASIREKGFTGTGGNEDQNLVKGRGEFQM